MSADNKWLFLTGATGGIGIEIARLFAVDGWNLCLMGRDRESLEKVRVNLLLDFQVEIDCVVMDISETNKAVLAFSSALHGRGGRMALIHAAGITGHVISETNYDEWRKIFSINLDTPFFISREFAEYVKGNNLWGSIVTISSTAAFYAGKPDYSASKLALVSVTRSLAKEYAKDNIRVNSVAPGYFETEMTNWTEEKRKTKINNVPLGRVAKAEEVASVVRFLCSDEASYITGAVIDVNGGLLNR